MYFLHDVIGVRILRFLLSTSDPVLPCGEPRAPSLRAVLPAEPADRSAPPRMRGGGGQVRRQALLLGQLRGQVRGVRAGEAGLLLFN